MSKAVALMGGDIITPKGIIKGGLLLMTNGRIEYAGARKAVDKKKYNVINVSGKTVSPGLIDAHTHLGVYAEGTGWAGEDGNEMVDPVTPHVRAIDSIDPTDKAFEEARQAGVTAVMITPGSANVIGGSICVAKTAGRMADEMVMADNIGQKMATGENPKRVYGSSNKAPMTRMGIAAVLRQALVAAQNYKAKIKKKKSGQDRDLKMEALLPIIDGKLAARVHAHRADDMATAMRIAEEFGLKLVIEHGTESYKIADILAKKKIPLNLGPTTTGRSKIELKDLARDNAAKCIRAGCHVSLITDHPVMPIQEVRSEAIKLVVEHGIDRDVALDCITINPAKTLGMDKKIGSLAKGKDADVAVFTGHPMDPNALCELTFIGGEKV
jgi:imidazolonepropionase-like amidohydrolase